jgi:hypothetical protein
LSAKLRCLCIAAPSLATGELAERSRIAGAAHQAFDPAVSAGLKRYPKHTGRRAPDFKRSLEADALYAGLGAALAGASVDITGSFEALEDKTAEWPNREKIDLRGSFRTNVVAHRLHRRRHFSFASHASRYAMLE